MIKSLILMLALSMLPSAAIAEGQMKIVTDPFPPFNYKANGHTAGIHYEIVKEVLEEMGIEFQLERLPWKRALLTIRKKAADSILDVSKDSERIKYILFPEEPLTDVPIVLFHLKDREFKFTDADSLRGNRIGLMSGYTYGGYFDDKGYLNLERVPNLEQNFRKLLAGRLDLVASYREVGMFTIRGMGISEKITFSPNPIDSIPMYLGFTKGRVEEDFVEKFNNELKDFKESGRDHEIRKRYKLNY